MQGPSQEAKQQLAAIFKKIGDRNSTEKGLEDLYFFKMSNPEIDIGVHLAKTSEAFRKYIQAGLDKVEGRVNRQRAAANGNSHLEEADRHNRLRGRFADSNGPALNPVRVSAQNMENLREKMKQIESGMPVASAHTAVPAGGSRAL